MANYNLQPNEAMIMKSDGVLYGGSMSGNNELLLTNLNIVLIRKGAFGKIKGIQTYPVNQIKVFNGQTQALIGKKGGGYPQLEVYFMNGQESFGFMNKNEAEQWKNNINQLVTGNSTDFQTTENKAIPIAESVNHAVTKGSMVGGEVGSAIVGAIPIPGTKFLGEIAGKAIGGIVAGTSKGVSEFAKLRKSERGLAENHLKSNERVTTKCVSCGAAVTGHHGQVVCCPYCGINQQL